MNMDLDKKLDALQQIKEVDAPPFLYTRIQQQIHNLQQLEAPAKWKWAFAFSTLLILLINISIMISSSAPVSKQNSGVENIVNSLGLSNTNDLYHE
jgi:hypothetical protein